MHQSFDINRLPETEAALRHALRRALARDLDLPESHVAVTATVSAFATFAHQRAADDATPASAAATLDTWWALVAHTHALTAR